MMLLFVFVGTLVGAVTKVNFWTLFIAHITSNIPSVLLTVLPRLRQTDKFLIESGTGFRLPAGKGVFQGNAAGDFPRDTSPEC